MASARRSLRPMPPAGAGAAAPQRRLTIGFMLARSFTLSPFSLFVDALRLGGDELDRSGRVHCDWEVLASTPDPVRSSSGVLVTPTAAFDGDTEFDYVVVVGGLLSEPNPLDAAARAFLRRAAARGTPLVGVCTGSFILAELGLMDGRTSCVSWLHQAEFRERFPANRVVSDRLFHVDGNRVTCAGGSSAVDLAAFLIRRHVGAQAERNALEVLQVERARGMEDLQPHDPLRLSTADPRLRAALQMMEQHVSDRLSLADIAGLLGLSRRQLERLFARLAATTPATAYAAIRIKAAHALVVHTRRRMIDIALETGFESASHFSRVFRGFYGRSPTSVRAGAHLGDVGAVAAPVAGGLRAGSPAAANE